MKGIVLHGWGHNAEMWSSFIDKTAIHFSAIDLPGFGKQKLVSDSWGIPEYADWVVKEIEKHEDILLIGHSFGGRIAAEIASRKFSWLKGLVLSGAPCIYRPSIKTQIKIYLAQLGKRIFPNKFQDRFLSKDLMDARKAGLERIFRAVVGYNQTKQLKEIDIPTLLIWGENDSDAPVALAQEIQSYIRNSELHILEHCGHNVFLENPNLFSGYVNTFIKTI